VQERVTEMGSASQQSQNAVNSYVSEVHSDTYGCDEDTVSRDENSRPSRRHEGYIDYISVLTSDDDDSEKAR